MAATFALNAGQHTDKPESPPKELTPTGTRALDCREIADYVEQARAEDERERQESSTPSTTGTFRNIVVTVATTKECAAELKDLDLKTH